MSRRGRRNYEEAEQKSFQQMLNEMKPLARQLTDREEKRRVVLWLRKLQEPVGQSPVKSENRNMYARLLLHMLKRGVLEGPFNQSPEHGELKTLPSYMSIYFDDPHDGLQVDDLSLNLSDSEFDLETETRHEVSKSATAGTKGFMHMSRAISPILSEITDQESLLETESQLPLESLNGEGSELDIDLDLELQELAEEERHASRSLGRPTTSRKAVTNVDMSSGVRDSLTRDNHEDDVDRLLTRRKGATVTNQMGQMTSSLHASGRAAPSSVSIMSLSRSHADAALQSFRDERNRIRLQQKEVDLKLKMADTRFQEEKLQLQSQHDRQLKEMLDHKNTEIEVIKAEMVRKVQEVELTVESLERKVAQLERECQHVREHKDKQLNELKTKAQQKIQELTTDYETKLEEAAAESEGQKLALKQQHGRSMQELVEETGERLRRMESEYNTQSESKDGVITELEGQLKRLRQDREQAVTASNRMARDKVELERLQEAMQQQLENTRKRIDELESERLRMTEEHEREVKELRSQSQAIQEEMKHEHTVSTARAADQISDLEQTLRELKRGLKLNEQEKQKSIKSLEMEHQREKQTLENAYEKKIERMQAELLKQEAENKQKVQKLMAIVKERDEHIADMKTRHQQQVQRAEQALDTFKHESDKKTERLYEDTRAQMQKVLSDLKKTNAAKEKLVRDSTREKEELILKHSRELSDTKLHYEQEKAVLTQQHAVELESIQRKQEREKVAAVKQMQSEMAEQEMKLHSKEQQDAQRMSELEDEVQKLHDELEEERSRHQSDMTQLELYYKEQQQLAAHSHDAAMAKRQSELEQHHLQLQQEHSAEIEKLMQRTNGRQKEMEREYTAKITKANEVISQLQSHVQELRAEKHRLKEHWQDQLTNNKTKLEADILSLRNKHHSTVQSIEQELMASKNLVRQLEKKIRQLQVEDDERVSTLRLQYEERLRGLMPGSVREQLEGTITSLKSQTRLLEQRNKLLQDELDSRQSPRTHSMPALSHPLSNTPYRPPVS